MNQWEEKKIGTMVERIYPNDKRVRFQTFNHHKARYELACKLRKPRGKALDICCGTGYGSEILRLVGYHVEGVDNSSVAIDYAEAHYPSCRFYLGDVSSFLPDGKYKLITFFEAIEHLTELQVIGLVEMVSKRLDREGVFILSTPREVRIGENKYHRTIWDCQKMRDLLCKNFSIEFVGQDWDTANFSKENVEDNDFYIAICQLL